MAVKKYKPSSPGRRDTSVSDFSEITKHKPEKSLLVPLKKTAGRNSSGRMTIAHRGGGHKRRYRLVDFRRTRDNEQATVIGIEYDPNRTARIALIEYPDGERSYILAPEGLTDGDTVISGEKVRPKVGNCMRLENVPLGFFVHNIELTPGKGGQMVRSAGAAAQVSAREGRHVHLILPSGEIRRVLGKCRATIGRVGNVEHENLRIGKAGRSRWMGKRPRVRGNAMNPVDHPMGGGEGHRSGGRHPCSRTGVLSKGGKTRKRKKYSDRLIVRRKKR